VSDPLRPTAPSRSTLLRGLVDQISQLGVPLRILAEEVLGLDSTIDLVAIDSYDRVALMLVSEDPDDLGLLTRGLAQRAWLRARLGDWLKLAPGLALRADAPVRLLLLAPDHPNAARAAVASLEAAGIELLRYAWLRDGGREALWVESPESRRPAIPAAPPATTARSAPPTESSFRSGLSERDLGLTPEELRELG
jgi:hypothetical protein